MVVLVHNMGWMQLTGDEAKDYYCAKQTSSKTRRTTMGKYQFPRQPKTFTQYILRYLSGRIILGSSYENPE